MEGILRTVGDNLPIIVLGALALFALLALTIGSMLGYRRTDIALEIPEKNERVETPARRWKIRPSKRLLFATAFIIFAGITLYRGWHPSATQLSDFIANREGNFCYGDFGPPGVTDFHALPKPGGDPYARPEPSEGGCMRARVEIEEISPETRRLKIVFWRSGRNRVEGEMRSEPFHEMKFGERIAATWRNSTAVDGLNEGSGWIGCGEIHKGIQCEGVLDTQDPRRIGQYQTVTFHQDQNRRR